MVFDALRLPGAPPRRLAPTERWYSSLFCLCLLAGSCALASFGFACATPFAAFAVVAADMLPLPQALLVMTAVWIVNQSIGFAALGYPLDASTLLWGFAIGVGALAATAEASVLVRSPIGSNQNAPAALGLAFVGAYSVYEVALFAFTPLLGGVGAFTPHIILSLGALNLLWLIGLSAVCVVCRHLGAVSQRSIPS